MTLEEDKKLKTHAKDGTREGGYGILATGAAVKLFTTLPDWAILAGPEIMIPVLAGFVVAVVKGLRNLIRKNLGIHLKGIV